MTKASYALVIQQMALMMRMGDQAIFWQDILFNVEFRQLKDL